MYIHPAVKRNRQTSPWDSGRSLVPSVTLWFHTSLKLGRRKIEFAFSRPVESALFQSEADTRNPLIPLNYIRQRSSISFTFAYPEIMIAFLFKHLFRNTLWFICCRGLGSDQRVSEWLKWQRNKSHVLFSPQPALFIENQSAFRFHKVRKYLH